MAKIKHEVIKEADLTNNCPECFNQELKLSFFQKHSYGKFVHKTTNEITSELKCKTCHTQIYPVAYTPDIERVFEYYQKMATPQKSSVKFTSLFYIILLVVIAVIAAGVYFMLESGLLVN
ncbi:hypothetical protein KO500_04015 [Cellulophaga baltica]|uniref:hypothetical protein n=1 Tax=Cellulophaga TaxID=104264 RepID=UPI001C073FB7|nr:MULTISPECIES: hypothetical protein [Cellulophaga]MBU2995580.1 hypothetical protein [Cellulophaga baltica]MDO6766974.1 hypothetical protein [Cellulophaga sp. 1_MG-2023]